MSKPDVIDNAIKHLRETEEWTEEWEALRLAIHIVFDEPFWFLGLGTSSPEDQIRQIQAEIRSAGGVAAYLKTLEANTPRQTRQQHE